MTNKDISIDPSNDKTQWSIVSNVKEENVKSMIQSVDPILEQKLVEEPELHENEVQNEPDLNNGEPSIVLNKIKEETEQNVSVVDDDDEQKSTISQNASSSAFNEIEEKLEYALLENAKLKSIVFKKNEFIRNRFNTVAILTKEIIEICSNYSNQFSEIKEILKQQKDEDEHLQEVISSKQSNGGNFSNYVECSNSQPKVSNPSEWYLDEIIENDSEEDTETEEDAEKELELQLKIKSLKHELATANSNYSQVQFKLQEMQNKHEQELCQFTEQLKKSHEEVKALKDELESPKNSDFMTVINDKCKKDFEKKYITEIIFALEQKIQEFEEINCMPDGETSQFNCLDGQSNDENVNMVKEKLYTIVKCFVETCARSTIVKDIPEECSKIIEIVKNAQVSNGAFTNQKIQDTIFNYNQMLITDQLQSLRDERTTMHVQKEYLKVVSKYSNFMDQIEIVKNNLVNNRSERATINFAEIEKCLFEDRKLIDVEKRKLVDERFEIEKEKEQIREQGELLKAEKSGLLEDKMDLNQKNRKLWGEITALKQTIANLKQNETTERNHNVTLEEKFEASSAELKKVKGQLNRSQELVQNLRYKISVLKDQENEITAYKLQSDMLNTEILEMREAEKNYLAQIENLAAALDQSRQEIDDLRNPNQNPNPNQPNVV